jgi:uncharacterized membrane protein (DUF485 family)
MARKKLVNQKGIVREWRFGEGDKMAMRGLDIKQKRAVKESFGALMWMGVLLFLLGFILVLIGYWSLNIPVTGSFGQIVLILSIFVLVIGILSVFFAHRAKAALVDAEVIPL